MTILMRLFFIIFAAFSANGACDSTKSGDRLTVSVLVESDFSLPVHEIDEMPTDSDNEGTGTTDIEVTFSTDPYFEDDVSDLIRSLNSGIGPYDIVLASTIICETAGLPCPIKATAYDFLNFHKAFELNIKSWIDKHYFELKRQESVAYALVQPSLIKMDYIVKNRPPQAFYNLYGGDLLRIILRRGH